MILGRALRSRRWRHRPGAADPGAGQGRARSRREDPALLPGHRREPRKRRWIVRPKRARSAANRGQRGRLLCPARRRMVRPFGGRTVPMMVMSHQYMLFDEVPEVAPGRRSRSQAAAAARRRQSPTTSGRKRTASTSAPMSATARRTGPTRPIRCPRISASSSIPTISSGWNGTSTMRCERVPLLGRRGWPRTSTGRSPTRRTATR
jgi:hypothetical protein